MTDEELKVRAESAATKYEANHRKKFAADERAKFVADFVIGFREGVRQEQERERAIFALPEATHKFEAAKNLALQTSLPVEKVQGILASLPERRENAGLAFDAAMARDNPELGAAGDGNLTEHADSKAKIDGVLRAAGYDTRERP